MDYSKFLNPTAKNIKPSGIRKFFDIVAERDDVISLGVGEPDFDTPWIARDTAIRTIKKGYTQYTGNAGLVKLRQLCCDYYQQRYNLKYNDKQCLITVGASEAIDISLRALVSYGDEVLVPLPSYVSYAPCITLAGGVPIGVNCVAENNFSLTAKSLEENITPKTKVLILPYPNNPTGAIMTKEQLEEISKVILKHDLFVISDEIYSELTYGQRHCSIASLENMQERCIVINGFSKAFAMTGWRLGFMLAPEEIIKVVKKIHQYGIICAPSVSQYAGVAMLEQSFSDGFSSVEEMTSEYDVRRRYVVSRLNSMGLKCFEPKGAFYAFPDVSALNMDGDEFTEKLLNEKSVAVVPGSAFVEGKCNYIRISYAYSMNALKKALDLIEEFVKEHK
ncbi:MAG TPA: pyridoxal phosphate-dependent aminotransferase [Clostridiales bacterium]|nr:pyridoxal phosphate-dependent aminotransferase [Clostridiales bacterium]